MARTFTATSLGSTSQAFPCLISLLSSERPRKTRVQIKLALQERPCDLPTTPLPPFQHKNKNKKQPSPCVLLGLTLITFGNKLLQGGRRQNMSVFPHAVWTPGKPGQGCREARAQSGVARAMVVIGKGTLVKSQRAMLCYALPRRRLQILTASGPHKSVVRTRSESNRPVWAAAAYPMAFILLPFRLLQPLRWGHLRPRHNRNISHAGPRITSRAI